ncbi:hypothetical protein SAMN05444581_11459 [Methylocapsa palsarum]|uniref:DUF1365 domain-containing protein n=1 Tax=Methylocapsa palsarum TaxID=1612308 RepID=A0A1I4BDS7_9HYPH|nr:hypothetical protein SAMN05444581_11459 [Methylocapsa palsarum]
MRYSVFSLLLDLDELPDLDRKLRLFAYNGWGLFSFRDSDHGEGIGSLRHWVERCLAKADINLDGGAIRVLCYPRILGYAFNPLTVIFCHSRDSALKAILYEVSNTHGERHTYVMPVGAGDAPIVRQSCRKEFFVSPFIPMNCVYDFKVLPPCERASILIEEQDEGGPLLVAAFSGVRRPLTDAALLRAFFTYPLMTIKVVAAIHFEALRLLFKKTPAYSHTRAKQRFAVSVGSPSTSNKA